MVKLNFPMQCAFIILFYVSSKSLRDLFSHFIKELFLKNHVILDLLFHIILSVLGFFQLTNGLRQTYAQKITTIFCDKKLNTIFRGVRTNKSKVNEKNS